MEPPQHSEAINPAARPNASGFGLIVRTLTVVGCLRLPTDVRATPTSTAPTAIAPATTRPTVNWCVRAPALTLASPLERSWAEGMATHSDEPSQDDSHFHVTTQTALLDASVRPCKPHPTSSWDSCRPYASGRSSGGPFE